MFSPNEMTDVIYVYSNLSEGAVSYGQQMLPLGLAWIASYLEKFGYSARIIDLNVEDVDVRSLIVKERPLVVGISGTTESRFESFRIARIVKEVDPAIWTVYGGPHASFTARDVLVNIPAIDVVAIGEGERTMLELVRTVECKHPDFSGVLGIAYRRDDKIYQTPLRPRILDLDVLPLPARHLLDMERYDLRMSFLDTKGDQIITARGCPFSCSFCSASALWGKSYTMRSSENVIGEIKSVADRYGVKGLKFFDSTFTVNKMHVLSICQGFEREGLNRMPWECEIRADTVDRQLLAAMRNAGCYYIKIGLESASERVLKRINKRITVDHVERTLNLANELGLRTFVFFTWGHPGETVEDMNKTLELSRKWRGRISAIGGPTPVKIYPGTAVEKYAKKIGCLPKGFSWSKQFCCETNKEFGISPNVPMLTQKGLGYTEFRKMAEKRLRGLYFGSTSSSQLTQLIGKE